jgi:Fe-S cluster assembly protein SufD
MKTFVDNLIGQAQGLIDREGNAEFINKFRRAALIQFNKLGFPNTRDENWKYTNIQPWLNKSALKETSVYYPVPKRFDKAIRIFTINGKLDTVANGKLDASVKDLPTGLHVCSFADALLKEDLHFKEYFGKLTNLNEHFSASNSSLFEDGLFIYITPGSVIDTPVHIIHTLSGTGLEFLHPRQLIIVGENAKLSILESFERDESRTYSFSNSMSELVMNKYADVEHYLINMYKGNTASVYNLEVHTGANSHYHHFNFSFPGSPLIRNNIHAVMNGEHAGIKLSGLYFSSDKQLVDNHTCVEHLVSNCNSDEKYKGILQGSSTAVFNGKIIVHPDAQRTTAYQQNNNLIMDDRATVYTKPELEIFADDVQCSHGATVGHFDQQALFYLQSRGITEKTAIDMLTQAFAFDIIEQIPQHDIKEYISQLLSSVLNVHP